METTSSPAGTIPAGEQQAAVVILNELLAECRDGDRAARRTAWAAIQDPQAMTILANGWRTDDGLVSTILSTIGGIQGCVGRARNLRRAISNLADDIQRRANNSMLDRLEQELSEPQNLRDCFGNSGPPASIITPDALEQLRVPRGYAIDSTGVYRLRATADGDVERIKQCSAPLFVGARTLDILTGEAKRQVIWRGPAGWCSQIVDRRTILDSARLITLADYEAPVSSANLGIMVKYLDEFEAENSHRLVSMSSTRRMGWQPDGSFLLPDTHFVPPDSRSRALVLTAPEGFETLGTGWVSAGSWAEWIRAVNLVTPYPYMFIAIYAAAASPLLHILHLPGFVVDFSGETSGGKTTALRMATSVWGKPAEDYPTAMYSWDSTKVWIERVSGFLQNLPVILDETKRAKHPNIVRDVIYDFCQGQGRGRGSKDGTRFTDSWRSVLISSGEGAATSFSQDAGTRARVLGLCGKPLGSNPEAGSRISEELQMVLVDNYGHLGRKVAEYLVSNTSQHHTIRDVFREARTKYAEGSESAVGRRHASYLAVMEVAASIVHQLGVPRPDCDPFLTLIESQTSAAHEADRGLAALQDAIAWASSNRHRFIGRHQTDGKGGVRVPNNGWAGKWDDDEWEEIIFTIVTLRDVLSGMGHKPDEILSRWAGRGWLNSSESRRSKTIRIEGVPTRCYCVTREAVDAASID